jgi:integrase
MAGEKKRQFGNIRKLSSGRYQARYRGPDGQLRPAPITFERKTDATRWLSLKEAEISKGEWIAPELGAQKFREYAEAWMRDRVLKPRTVELYTGLLPNHLYPTFGAVSLSDIDAALVRRWRKERLQTGSTAKRPFGPVTVAKAYRLLHAIFETAVVEDRIILHNPCNIKGAGSEESDEREIVPLSVVLRLADTVPVRYRALILLAIFADMRWGELAGLRRENIDLDACEIRITQTLVQPGKGGCASTRPSHKPVSARWRSPKRSPGRSGGTWSGSPSQEGTGLSSSDPRVAGCAARTSTNQSGARHARRWASRTCTSMTCGTPAAPSSVTGATLKELMVRLGHSSPQAALIYQHASRDRDRLIAKGLGNLVRDMRAAPGKPEEEEPERGERGA